MKLCVLEPTDLALLDDATGGLLHAALHQQAEAGHGPELCVRRDPDLEVDLPRWFVTVPGVGQGPEKTFEIKDASVKVFVVLASLLLSQTREAVLQELSDRLHEERRRR
jgi:hypothetical protein